MITIVSGLPRSGTSMMMRILQAGGMRLLIDEKRPADDNNRYGYFEYEPVKRLAQDNSWLNQAEDKTVKIIVQLLAHLPTGPQYKIILMNRSIDEILASQGTMLKKLNREGTSLSNEQLKQIFLTQIAQGKSLLQKREDTTFIEVDYGETVAYPQKTVEVLKSFLDIDLNTEQMTKAVDSTLYRSKA